MGLLVSSSHGRLHSSIYTLDVIGQLLSATGQDGEDTKEKRWREEAGYTHGSRSHCATGGQGKTGTGSGTAVPCRFLRVPTGEVGIGCSRSSAKEMLAL